MSKPRKLANMQIRNFAGGIWRYIQNTITPLSTYKNGINLDSDKKLGSLVIRKGLEIINSQLPTAGNSFYGMHQHVEQDSNNNALLAVLGTGEIYNIENQVSTVTDTPQLRTRFVTYLGETLRFNGTDSLKAFKNDIWIGASNATFTANISDTITSIAHGLSDNDIVKFITTDTLPTPLESNTAYYIINKTTDTFEIALTVGGTTIDITDIGTGTHTWQKMDVFDLSNMPNIDLGVEWKDRFYGVDLDNPDTLLYSGIADYTSKTLSWTSGNGSIVMEREDNGGGITALVKVPGYLLVFKRHTMKRWNGTGTYPEDLINQGAPSQEAVCVGRGMAMVLNENGIWATNGGYPQRISRPIADIIEAIPAANFENITSYCDDSYAQWSVGDIKIDGITQQNVVIKFNLDDNSFNVRSYGEVISFQTRYVSGGKRYIATANDDSEVFTMDTGTTDNEKALSFQLDLEENDFGLRGRTKTITQMSAFITGTENAQLLARCDSQDIADYKKLADLKSGVTNIDGISLRCNVLDVRMSGISKSGGVVIDGLEFDNGGVQLNETKK